MAGGAELLFFVSGWASGVSIVGVGDGEPGGALEDGEVVLEQVVAHGRGGD